jgi:hypothetical protein
MGKREQGEKNQRKETGEEIRKKGAVSSHMPRVASRTHPCVCVDHDKRRQRVSGWNRTI